MLLPDFLKPNDAVGILSTARKISKPEMDFAIQLLESWELKPVFGKTIGKSYYQFAGKDADRAEDFQHMIDRPDIKAIWCARGGYGTVRMVDLVDYSSLQNHPKWIIGYSDITVLHAELHNLGLATIHAPMPIDIGRSSSEAVLSLKNALFGYENNFTVPAAAKNRLGTCKGRLVGGNLSILYSICGSASAMDFDQKILCIEDIDEYLYHFDRMLQNLKRNGVFDKLAGMLVGGLTNMHDNAIPFGRSANEIIRDITEPYDFPIAFNLPFGHLAANRALTLGAEAQITVAKDSVSLEYVSSEIIKNKKLI